MSKLFSRLVDILSGVLGPRDYLYDVGADPDEPAFFQHTYYYIGEVTDPIYGDREYKYRCSNCGDEVVRSTKHHSIIYPAYKDPHAHLPQEDPFV